METKKIIITGGATRIGKSIALALASYDTQIVIHYSKSGVEAKKLKLELENLGTKIFLIKADLSKETDVNKLIKFSACVDLINSSIDKYSGFISKTL